MYIHNDKPALVGAVTSAGIPLIAHASAATVAATHPGLEVLKLYLGVIGQAVGILAGIGSFSWYVYSFIKARKSK